MNRRTLEENSNGLGERPFESSLSKQETATCAIIQIY